MTDNYREFLDSKKNEEKYNMEQSFFTDPSFFNAPFKKINRFEEESDENKTTQMGNKMESSAESLIIGEKEDRNTNESLDPSTSIIFSQDKTNFTREDEKIEISWRRFIVSFISCSLFLPLYVIALTIRHHHSEQAIYSKISLTQQALRIVLAVFYYISFITLIILYAIHLPSSFSPMEVLFPIFLHFFSCFVWIFSSQNFVRTSTSFLPSSHPMRSQSSEDKPSSSVFYYKSKNNNKHFTEQLLQNSDSNLDSSLNDVNTQNVNNNYDEEQREIRSFSSNILSESFYERYYNEYIQFRKNQEEEILKRKIRGKMFLLQKNESIDPFNVKNKTFEEKEVSVSRVVDLLYEKTEEIEKAQKNRKEYQVLIPFLCSLLFSSVPQLWRIVNGLEVNFQFAGYFYFIIIFSFLINFQICFVSFYVLHQTILHLKKRLLIAQLFSELNSESNSFYFSLFYFKLADFNNLWGWLSLRGYLMKEGKRRQIIPEITLSTYLAFLIPLSISILFELFLNKKGFSIFVISGILFSALLFVHIIICVRLSANILHIFQNDELLLTQQIELNYQICTSSSEREISQLKNLVAAMDKVLHFIKSGDGKGVVMKILGFEVTEKLSQILIASAISFLSAGISKLLVF